MNRRDTIIIAVLLNAALLAILFVMAINNDDNSVMDPAGNTHVIADVTETPLPPSQEIITLSASSPQVNTPPSGDEIDQALKQYANNPELILVDDEAEPTDKEPLELPAPITTTPPQNPEPPPSTQHPQVVDVTVKKGDALEKIARANNTTVDAIKKANNLTNNKLSIGQVLKVPVNTKKASTATAQSKSSATKESKDKAVAMADPEFYTIKSGDNPWKIAKQFHVKFDELLKMNNLDEEKARNLKVGDKIRVK
jgi:peptidoglycan DL-endopeptidase LytF